MTEALAVAGAVLAWVGAGLLTLSEGRRGAALGLALAGVGLAVAAAVSGRDPLAAGVLAAGGVGAAAGRLRGGGGWGVLPPGSTPRLIATIVTPLVAAIAIGPVIGTPAGAALLGALVVSVGAAGRILTVSTRWSALAGGSALALGLGAMGDDAALVAAGLVAAGLGLVDGADRPETVE